MTDKYHSDTQEKTTAIVYQPGCQNTGDLEAGTNTITATTEASGTASADYSKALTLDAPADARLVLRRVTARLAVTIDSMTAGHLYCRVYVDAQDSDHRLFDEDWTTTGEKLDAVDTHSGALDVIFGLLKDGAEHTFYFFFWVDSGDSVISLVQLWEGVGSCVTSGITEVLRLNYEGFYQMFGMADRIGSGTVSSLYCDLALPGLWIADFKGSVGSPSYVRLTKSGLLIHCRGSVATDLNYVQDIAFILRSEQ